MKTWTTPVMQELDVMLTASSGDPGTTEKAASWPYLENLATYDSSMYEKQNPADDTCTIVVENSLCATAES